MSELKQRLLNKMLDAAGKEGWSNHTLESAAKQLGMDAKFAYVGFPQGATDAMVFYMRQLDKEMLDIYNQSSVSQKRVRDKAIFLIATRLKLLEKHKEAVKSILQFTLVPSHAIVSAESLATTCDRMWKAIGDTATDFNFYSKRFLLASVYSSALLYWIRDESSNHKETQRFLENRIDELFNVMRTKSKMTKSLENALNKGLSFFKKK